MFLDRVSDSPAYEVFNLVFAKRAKGEDVVSLAIGEPSFDTPKEIIEAARKSLERGEVHYTSSRGTSEVREAIKEKARHKNGIHAEIDNTIFLTTKLAVYASLMAISDENFEALVPDPGYYYSEPVVLAGGTPVRYRLADDFSLDMTEIAEKSTPRTKAIVLNTPSNPTGRVLDRGQLQDLYDFCRRRKIAIISDESYEDLVYDTRHFSIGSLEASPELVLSLFSLSKSYAMTGWRAGYVVGSEKLVGRMNTFLENTMSCFPPFIQAAAAYALLKGDGYPLQFREELGARKKLLEEKMDGIPELRYRKTEGAFYSFPRYSVKVGSRAFCKRLLDEYNVAVLPGAIFGPSGEGHLRISFAGTPETIEEGMRRMKLFFKSLNS